MPRHSICEPCLFADRRLRLALRLRGKHILRRAVQDLIPRPILRRSKRGFGLPLERWMKEDLNELIHDVLLDRTARERGLFDPKAVAALVADLDRNHNAPDRVWTLLVLELWFREVASKVASSSPPLIDPNLTSGRMVDLAAGERPG